MQDVNNMGHMWGGIRDSIVSAQVFYKPRNTESIIRWWHTSIIPPTRKAEARLRSAGQLNKILSQNKKGLGM